MALLCWKRCKILKFIILFFAFVVCMGLSACSQKDNAGQNVDVTEILQEIDEYKTKFIGLYTSNVYEDTESAIRIEENDFIYMNEQIAVLTRYSDLSDKHLRYKIQIDGETGNVIINYYLCEGFVWINEQRNYYSSWIPGAGYPDILYSETEQWILIGETVYILHDNGDLEEVPWEQLNIPALEELDEIMSCDFEGADSTVEQEDAESPEMEDSLNTNLFQDFKEMDYALFLESTVSHEMTNIYNRYGIYGDSKQYYDLGEKCIRIYDISGEEIEMLWELTIPEAEAGWPVEISQMIGNREEGWLVFSSGDSAYRMDYPGGEAEKLGEFMYGTVYSPDGKYRAYCTGYDDLFDCWETMAYGDKEMQELYFGMRDRWTQIPLGWYVEELETGNKTYIPMDLATFDINMYRPLYGGRCVWIEKDKLLQMLDQ